MATKLPCCFRTPSLGQFLIVVPQDNQGSFTLMCRDCQTEQRPTLNPKLMHLPPAHLPTPVRAELVLVIAVADTSATMDDAKHFIEDAVWDGAQGTGINNLSDWDLLDVYQERYADDGNDPRHQELLPYLTILNAGRST